MIRFLALALWLVSVALPANADGWFPLRTNFPIDDADRDGVVDYMLRTESVYYRSEGDVNLMLTCSDRNGLMVSFGLENIDFKKRMMDVTGRARLVRIKLLIDGDRSSAIRSVYLPTLKVVEPTSTMPARKVFNSVIKQVPVEITMPGKGKFTYTPPPTDDTFRQFAKSCPAVSG